MVLGVVTIGRFVVLVCDTGMRSASIQSAELISAGTRSLSYYTKVNTFVHLHHVVECVIESEVLPRRVV